MAYTSRVRTALLALTLLAGLPVLAQHDITQVEPAAPDAAIATPLPESQRRMMKKYDTPELAGARQAVGPQLIDGRLRRPLIDYTITEGPLEQRISIFEQGLVYVKMTGASSVRKRLLIPQDALDSFVKGIDAAGLRAIRADSLPAPDPHSRAHLRVYEADGTHVDRVFHPGRVLPKQIVDRTMPLLDLMRAVTEDREVTSSVAGYEPKPGDELVGDDQKTWRVVRVVEEAGVVELQCLDVPMTIYVAKKELHLYFIGAKPKG